MNAIVFRHHIFQGPDRGWETDPHCLADFSGHSLESGAQEVPVVTVLDFDLFLSTKIGVYWELEYEGRG